MPLTPPLRVACLLWCLLLAAGCTSSDDLTEPRSIGRCLDSSYREAPCGEHEYLVESYKEPGASTTCANDTETFRPWPSGGGHCISRVGRVSAPRESVDEWATRNQDALTDLAVAVQRLQQALQDSTFFEDPFAARELDLLALQLRNAVDAASAAGPVPEPDIQAAWSEALAAQRSAVNTLRIAAAGTDEASLQAALTELNEAAEQFAEVGQLLPE